MNYIGAGVSFLSSATRQAAQVLLPVAVSAAIEAGLQDQRIGKIVGGSCLIISGISVTIASGVPARLKARFITKKEIDSFESTKKTALRYGAATVGLVTTCYGVYAVAMGVLELMTWNENSVQSATMPDASSIVNCREGELKNTKEELLRCPEAQKLWNEVDVPGPFTLCVNDPDEGVDTAR